MKIHRMSAVFGRLDHESLELGPGLNVLQAPNETGKSTWCAFLLSMFYGVNSKERDRAGSLADKNRYQPWSGTAMSGRLDCRDGDTELTLTRETRRANAPMGVFRGVYAGTNDDLPDLTGLNCGETLLGVTREVFERSAFIRQTGLPISQDAGLERRIASLITSGEEDTSYSETADALKKQLNRRRHNRTGQIPAAEAELEESRRQLAELEQLERSLTDARREIETLSGQETELAEQLRERAQGAQLLRKAGAEQAEQTARALRDLLESTGVPENDTIARLRGAIVNLETVRRSVDKARESRDEALKRRLRAESAVRESPFSGQSAESALKAARTEPAVHPGLGKPVAAGLLAAAVGAALGWLLRSHGLAVSVGTAAAAVGAGLLIAVVLFRSDRRKAQTAARIRQFGTADPAELTALAETYSRLLDAQTTARNEAAAASATAESLYATLCSNEQAILLEVRRFAPSAFDIPTADQLLRQSAVRRKQLAETEAAARESRLRYELQGQQLAGGGVGSLSPEERELSDALEHTRRALGEARSAADRLSGRLSAAGDRSELQARAEQLEAQIQAMEGDYSAIALALTALDEANTALQNRFSPALGRRASEIFSQLTGGRYDSVTLDRTLRLAAEPAGDSVFRDVQLLSAGAADQLYLATRLAICELVLPDDREVPVILDDALANFDDRRCAAALRWLRKESEKRQILLFTCHSREAEFFRGDPAVRIQELTATRQQVL